MIAVNVEGRYVSRLRQDAADRLEGIAGDLLADARESANGHAQAPESAGQVEQVARIATLLSELGNPGSDSVRVTCDGSYLLREIQAGLYREADALREISESASLRIEDVPGIVERLHGLTILATGIQQQTGGTD